MLFSSGLLHLPGELFLISLYSGLLDFAFSLYFFLDLILTLLSALFQLLFLNQLGLIREVEPLRMVRIRSYYRDINSNCGSWLNNLCRTVASASSVGTET